MKAFRRLALTVICFPLLAGVATAQKQRSFLQFETVTVQPASVTEYEDYLRKIVTGAAKVGASPTRVYAHQVTLGGPSGTYVLAIPFAKWEEMDTWTPIPQLLAKAYGEAEGARILRAGRAATQHSKTEVYRLMPRQSSLSNLFDPPTPFVNFMRTQVRGEMLLAYQLWLAKFKVAEEKASGAAAFRGLLLYGPWHSYLDVRPFTKHAERDAWPSGIDMLRSAYGEAETDQINDTYRRSVEKRETWILTYRPDLSRSAPVETPSANR